MITSLIFFASESTDIPASASLFGKSIVEELGLFFIFFEN